MTIVEQHTREKVIGLIQGMMDSAARLVMPPIQWRNGHFDINRFKESYSRQHFILPTLDSSVLLSVTHFTNSICFETTMHVLLL